jgi:hypothetical protein
MWKRLPFKKEYLLVAGAVVLLWLSYQLAFKGTIAAWQMNAGLKAQLNRSVDVNYQPSYLNRKNNNLDKILKLYRADTAAFRSNSISLIAGIAEKAGVKLSEVPVNDPFYHTDRFLVQKLGFEGDFFSLTRVLHQLQQTPGIGQVRGADYHFGHEKKLVLEVFLEIVK